MLASILPPPRCLSLLKLPTGLLLSLLLLSPLDAQPAPRTPQPQRPAEQNAERTIDAPDPYHNDDLLDLSKRKTGNSANGENQQPGSPRIPRLEILFSPFKTDRASLSPDGRHIAYTLREGDRVSVIVLEVDNPAVIKAKVAIIDSESATAMLDPNNREKTPGAVRWMRWATNERLVLESNLRVALSNGTEFINAPQGGAIIGFNADGGNARILCTARDTSDIDVRTPLDTTQKASPQDASTAYQSTVLASDETTIAPPETVINTHISAKAPHVVDLIPGDPDHILIRTDPELTEGEAMVYALYKLDINTGKLKRVSTQFLENGETTLLDRQGCARVSIPISFRHKFPHAFRYSTTSLFSKAKPLDQLASLKDAFVVSPNNYFGKRSVPLGFEENGTVLYYASNMTGNTYGIYGIDLATGKPAGAKLENPVFDLYEPAPDAFPNYSRNLGDEYAKVRYFGFADTLPPERETLVFDRHSRKVVGVRFEAQRRTAAWFLPELHAAQVELQGLMPGSGVEIQEWDAKRSRFLVRAESPSNPGAFFIYDRAAKRLAEFVRAEPLINESNTHENAEFAFKHPSGERVTGLLTLPRYVRISPAPLIIVCSTNPWERLRPIYKPEVQALANLGFAVAQVSSRAAWGLGAESRISAGVGAEKAFADDVRLVADQLAKRFNFNRQRVALYGEGMGAFCALWTLQMHPEAFRCAVVLNPIIDPAIAADDAYNANGSIKLALEQGFFGGAAQMKKIGLSGNNDRIDRPVCFLSYRGIEGERRLLSYIDARAVFSKVQDRAKGSEFFDLDADYMNGLPAAKSEAFRNIGGFLNLYLYGFKTNAGATKIIPDGEKK